MKLLSIDVGMKNLAYCVIDVDLSQNTDIIHKWGVINLCEDDIIKCMGVTKQGTPCNKQSTYFKNDMYYCKTHAKKQTNYMVPTSELRPNKLKKYKIKELKNLCEKYNFPIEKKMKKIDIYNLINDCLSKKYLNFVIKIRASQYNLVEYGRNMKNKFNEVLKDIDIDYVIVENQIGPLALRMKTLQGMIMQHFIERDIKCIKEVSSSNKLREFVKKAHTSYNERKKESIKATKNILLEHKEYFEWLPFFNKHSKKDDLADCFLQAKWYIKYKNYIL
tara:strand:+ start:469 stop:1296 length:828 start_codon:yes stop_codon:yes gene_type:complete